MTSKNLFFKLMRENTKQRLWTVALISLFYFFYFPVHTALNISSLDPSAWNQAANQAEAMQLALDQLGRGFMNSCSIQNPVMVMLMFLFSAVCGISGFAYLFSRKKTDFYHSIPVRRELLFLVSYVNGVLFVAVPHLVSMLIAACMVFAKGAGSLSLSGMMTGWLMHMAFYLLLYSTVIAAVMLTGNLIVSCLGTLVFYLWAPCVFFLTEGYCATYYITYYNDYDMFVKWSSRLSPAGWYLSAVSAETPASMAVKAFLAAVLITGLALYFYRKRPSESAGRAMAFRISQPIIKVFIVIPSALLGSLLFYSMREQDSWAVFGLICGLLVSCCIIEIIYSFDFRRLFDHKRQLALCGVVSAAVLAFFRFDIGGYDSYCPSESRLQTIGIYCSTLDANVDQYHAQPKMVYDTNGKARYVNWYYSSDGEVAGQMQLEDLTPAHEIAERAVENVQEQRKARFTNRRWDPYESRDGYVRDLILCYQLNSGKKVFRSYTLDLRPVCGSLDAIYSQQGYKEAIYPVLKLSPEEVAGINYKEQSEYSHVKLADDTQKAQLLEIYQKELSELTTETRRKESPIAALQFKTMKLQKMIDEMRRDKGDYTQFNSYLYFPVYPSFTGTIAMLKECGTEVGSVLNENTVEKIALEYIGSYPASLEQQGEELSSGRPDHSETKAADLVWSEERRESPSVMITKKDQIREILESSVSQDLNCTNRLNVCYGGIRIVAFVPYSENSEEMNSSVVPVDTESFDMESVEAELEMKNPDLVEYADDGSQSSFRTYTLTFAFDKVPSFVKEEFGLTGELMEHDKEGFFN